MGDDRLLSGPEVLDRMVRAVDKVRQRLLRAASALESAGIDYAVVGGNAVAAWVARVDEAAVRNTQDVDILLRRSDLDRATPPLEAAGFVRRHVKGIDLFLDGPNSKARDALHILFAGERVRPEYIEAAPDVGEFDRIGPLRVLSLPALVRMKLSSFRIKDRMHRLDLIEVGLIDGTWVDRLPEHLRTRLRELLENPEGLPPRPSIGRPLLRAAYPEMASPLVSPRRGLGFVHARSMSVSTAASSYNDSSISVRNRLGVAITFGPRPPCEIISG